MKRDTKMFVIDEKIVTFGSDFELATMSNNKIIPALGVEGTKEDPMPIGNGCYQQRDAVNAEYNIPPVNTKKDWMKYTDFCFHRGAEILAKQGLSLVASSSHVYEAEDLDKDGLRETHCNESYDAYTKATREFEDVETNMRSCGYHVHLGFNFKCAEKDTYLELEDMCNLAHYFDLHLGLPSVLIDKDKDRRSIYGMPGDFRFNTIEGSDGKPINLWEYRSLGGNLLGKKKYIAWVYDAAKRALKAYNKQDDLPDLETMRQTILNSDTDIAKALTETHNIKIA